MEAFMERSPVGVRTFLLGAGLVLAFSMTAAESLPQPPRLIRCVFQNRANVTCFWEPGDTLETNYTLRVKYIPTENASNGSSPEISCTTSETSCTVITRLTVRNNICISITEHRHNTSSAPRCQSGRIEVMMPPVTLFSVKPVIGRPRHLNVSWKGRLAEFPVSQSEVKAGHLESQIEVQAQGQFNVQVQDVKVTNYSFLVGVFRPDTLYSIRLRHRYKGPQSPWSPWSNTGQGRTGEDAPSAPPAFWRQVRQTDKDGWRLVSLLWKPLPHSLANGRVLFYNVTCQTDDAQLLEDHGGCGGLRDTSALCSVRLPDGRCSCALTASTSAGTSPEARIWLIGASETDMVKDSQCVTTVAPPPPRQITATRLDDNSLDVRWLAPADPSARGFVVEWFAVRGDNGSVPRWDQLNPSCTAVVITEGVKPMERYVVSVKALFGERGVGQNGTIQLYTRQGAPTAGPKVHVDKMSGSTVELIWTPVPVALLRGFIRNYTVSYSTANQLPRRVFVPGHTQHYSLKNLSPGHYNISMQANTDGGAGAAGPITKVSIHEGSEEIPILAFALLPVLLTSLALVLMACLSHSNMVKQKLCPDVPDPSESSLAHWTPKATLESMKSAAAAEKPEIKYNKVALSSVSELQDSGEEKELCDRRTFSTYDCSSLSVSGVQTYQTIRQQQRCIKAQTTSITDLSSPIYPQILFSQTLKSLSTPLLCSSYHRCNEAGLQPGGDSEPRASLQVRMVPTTDSPLHQTDEWRTIYSSVHSLQPSAFARPDADTLNASLSPFPHSLFVDLSYCPLEIGPYMPTAAPCSFMPEK